METIVITLCEYRDWGREDDGTVAIADEDATMATVVGCASSPEEAAGLIADFCRARPPVDDGYEDGHEEVLPISHFTLNAVRAGAPLSGGRAFSGLAGLRHELQDVLLRAGLRDVGPPGLAPGEGGRLTCRSWPPSRS